MPPGTVHHVTTLELPALRPYRTLRRAQEHIDQGIFVAEGEKVVRRLLHSGLTPVSFLLTPEWDEELRRSEPRYPETDADIHVAPRPLLEEIVGYRMHQGIMAVAGVPADPSLPEILARSRPLIVALDGLMNAENVGVVVRNCAGFGADAVLVGETSSSPYLRRAVRNSMGTVFTLPVVHCGNLASDLQRIRDAGGSVVGTDPLASDTPGSVELTDGICLVLGNEESGLSDAVRSVCDRLVRIPMHRGTDSLNVSSASAVFLYETVRQREAG